MMAHLKEQSVKEVLFSLEEKITEETVVRFQQASMIEAKMYE